MPSIIPDFPETCEGQKPQAFTTDVFYPEINVLDLLLVLANTKRTIARFTIAAGVLSLLIVLLIPSRYTATTRMMPPQQAQSTAAAMLGQLNPLAATIGKDLQKSPSDIYISMLKSRTVADDLIARFDLRQVYRVKRMVDAREFLAKGTSITAGKDGVVTVSVEDKDPKRAMTIANAYVDELYKMTQNLAVTEASQRRLFFERQIGTAKENLAEAELALKQTQERTGLIQLDGQAKAIIESAAVLQAQIAAKEVQLQRMRLFATEQNPDIVGVEQELAGLRGQLAKAEQSRQAGNGNIQIASAKVPEAGLQYVRRLREVKYNETIFEMLAKQYEAARIDEAKNAVIVQVIDAAVEPEKKSGPDRTMIVLSSTAAGFLLSCMWAFSLAAYDHLKQIPEQSERLRRLRASLTSSPFKQKRSRTGE